MKSDNLPHNVEAEVNILAAMLVDKKCVGNVIDSLRVEALYREAHKVIYRAIIKLFKDNAEIDYITVSDMLENEGKLEDVGGLAYLLSLSRAIPTCANVKTHIKIVNDLWVRRNIIKLCDNYRYSAYNPGDESIDKILGGMQQDVFNVDLTKKNSMSSLGDIITPLVEEYTSFGDKTFLRGVPIGYKDFDVMTAGLAKTDYMLLAARPSMGKTALALNIALNIAKNIGVERKAPPGKVLFFSLEMSKELLGARLISAEAMLESHRMRLGRLADEEWNTLFTAADVLQKLDMTIDDYSGHTVTSMLAAARRVKEKYGLSIIIIDYLQLIQSDNKGSRYEVVSEISRMLKSMARSLEVPVLALSQLSRAVESRQDKRPMLSDLRESGSLEQDADLVAFLYRDDYYNSNTDIDYTELFLAKNRNGPTGAVKLSFDKAKAKFTTYQED